MLYKSYQKKIERIAKFVDTVKKYKVLILSIIGALLAVLTAFLSVKGMMTNDLNFPINQFTYGYQIEGNAEALFGSVGYQYRLQGEQEWTDGTPNKVGVYEVRAVSNRTFNIKQYGDVNVIEIRPKDVNFYISSSSVTYGETPDYSISLVGYDRVKTVEIDMEKRTGTMTAGVLEDSVVIVDKDGNDVTNCYNVINNPKSIIVEKRPITLTVEGAEKVYDGEPLVSNKYSLDQLAYSDNSEVSFSASLTECGTVKNTPEYVIKNAEGKDVTDYYSVKLNVGNLKVTKRPITIMANPIEREYNGQPLTCESVAVSDGVLVGGQSVTDWAFDGEITDVGEKEVALKSVKILSGSNDVTENYECKLVGATATVYPRDVKISVYDEKTYDGKTLDVNNDIGNMSFVSGELLSGHLLTVSTVSPNANTYGTDGVSWTVVSDSKDLSTNYKISFNEVDLTINKKDLTLTAESHEKVYDSQTYTAKNYSKVGLIDGHEIDAVVSGSVTDFGKVDSIVTCNEIYFGEEKVTMNYNVKCVKGSLEVTKCNVKITPSVSKTYDDTDSVSVLNATFGLFVIKEKGDGTWETGLYGNQEVDAKYVVERNLINANEYKGVVIVDESTIEIKNGKLDNYYITCEKGDLTIKKRDLTIITPTGFKEYNGYKQNLTISEDKNPSQYVIGLVEGHEVQFTNWLGLTDYTEEAVENTVDVDDITDKNTTESKIDNYNVFIKKGKFNIVKRKISVNLEKEETYAHKKFVYDSGLDSDFTFENEKGLVLNHRIVLQTKDVVAKTYRDSDVTWGVYSSGEDCSYNYDVNTARVEIIVNKREITVGLEMQPQIYLGSSFRISGNSYASEFIDAKNLFGEHRLYLTLGCEESDVGKYPLELIEWSVKNGLSGKAEEIYTENYVIKTDDKTFEIEIVPKKLTVRVDYRKDYDGTAYFADINKVLSLTSESGAGAEMSGGQKLALVTSGTEDCINAGEYPGVVIIDDYAIQQSNGQEVHRKNYDLTFVAGDVSIAKRKITITSSGKNFFENAGKIFTHCEEGVLNVMAGELPKGHDLLVDMRDPDKIPSVSRMGDNCENVLPYVIADNNGNDCKANYDVTEIWGWLTVGKIEIIGTVVAGSNIYYDGQAQELAIRFFGASYIDEEGKKQRYEMYGDDEIKADKYYIVDERGDQLDEIIDAGEYTIGVKTEDLYIDRNGERIDIFEVYNLAEIPTVKFVVEKANVTITTLDVTVNSPKTPEDLERAQATIQNSYERIDGVYDPVSVKMHTDIDVEVGSYKRNNHVQTLTIDGETHNISEYATSHDGFKNYHITFEWGTLTVK